MEKHFDEYEKKVLQNISNILHFLLEGGADGHKYTQDQVAESLGISQPAFSRWTKGDRDFGVTNISKLADFFRVPISIFFYDKVPVTIIRLSDNNVIVIYE